MHFTEDEIHHELRRLMPPEEMEEAAFQVWAAAVLDPTHALHERARAQESEVLRRFVEAFHAQARVAVQKHDGLHEGVLVGKVNSFPIPLGLVEILHTDFDAYEYGVWFIPDVVDALQYDRPLVHPNVTSHMSG